jgi:SAM-dependent methyltransferase
VDLQTFRELLTPAGAALLAEACQAYDDASAVTLATRLRRHHPADLVAAALTQAALRRRATAKWGDDAARMYFTRDGLEQATTREVATYRAHRIAAHLTTSAPATDRAATGVLDLCCGIGGDLIAFAAAREGAGGERTTHAFALEGPIVGVDRDPLTVEIARANLAAFGLSARATVEVADATRVERTSYAVTFADPARRTTNRRVFDPADYSPPWSFVEELLAGTACVKTAPIIGHELVPDAVEAEWISVAGEVKEAALWSGELRSTSASGEPVRRRATILESEKSGPWTTPRRVSVTDADDPGEVPVCGVAPYLYEPDPAVIRAGLVGAVAAEVSGGLVSPGIAYVTAERLVGTPLATAYQVLDVLAYDVKALRRALRDHDIGQLTIKKRGVELDPPVLRKRLAPRGSRPGTVIVTKQGQRAVALLVEPCGRGRFPETDDDAQPTRRIRIARPRGRIATN